VTLLALVPASRLPRAVRSSLDHLAPAVLAAIAAVDLAGAMRADSADAAVTLAAAAVIALAAWRTRSVLISSGVAVAVVCLLDLAFG
jgi:branched-subunit amino acid transport protein